MYDNSRHNERLRYGLICLMLVQQLSVALLEMLEEDGLSHQRIVLIANRLLVRHEYLLLSDWLLCGVRDR